LIEGEIPESIMKLFVEPKKVKKGKLILRTNKDDTKINIDF